MVNYGSGPSGNGAPDSGNLANEAATAVRKAGGAVAEGVKDAKAIKEAASQLASGNVAGAAITAAKNPKTTLKVLLVVIVLSMIPFIVLIGGGVFILSFPGAIIESVEAAASETMDSIVLGWEDIKIKFGNAMDDFLTLLTTGEWGESSQAYQDDVAIANEPEFGSYIGTSNTIVAVLNEYFRDAYNDFIETKAKPKAEAKLEELKQKARDEGVSEAEIHASLECIGHPDATYYKWTFYIMAGDSYDARDISGVHFRIKEMLEVAKEMAKESLWTYDIQNPTYTITEETRQEEYQIQVPKLDDFGDVIIDEETGEAEYEWETRTRDIQVQVAYIGVTYSLKPKASAEQAILDHYGITDEAKEGDMSDKKLVEEQVDQMCKLYSTLDNALGGGSEVSGGVAISGTIVSMLERFYQEHSFDELFVAPSIIGGPWSGWKNNVTSHLGEARWGTTHNGTDIYPPDETYPLYAPSQGIVVEVQRGYANGALVTAGNGARGNFVIVYYGESGSVEDGVKKGQFCLYQHLNPEGLPAKGAVLNPGDLIGYTGYSGYCVSSRPGGTGEHLHLESYKGTGMGFSQYDPENGLTG